MNSPIHLFIVALLAVVAPVYSQTIDPGYNNVIQLGPNIYTFGFNLEIPNPIPTNQKYYEASGLSDHTTLFTLALNEINSQKGGILSLGQGTYTLKAQQELPSNFQLAGAGMGKTILQISNDFIGTSLLHTNSGIHIAITGMTLIDIENQSNSITPFNGVYIESTENVWIDQIEVKDFTGVGIKVRGRLDPLSRYFTMTNSKAYNNANHGFSLDQSQYNVIHNCVSQDNDLHGFYFDAKTYYTNITNSIANNNGFGMSPGCGFSADNNNDLLFPVSTLMFKNNQVTGNNQAGFCLNNINFLFSLKNTITESPYCFIINNLKYSEITNNQCSANTQLYFATKAIVATSRSQYIPETMVLIDTTNTFTIWYPKTLSSDGSSTLVQKQITPSLRTLTASDQTSLVVTGPNVYTIGYNLCITTPTSTTRQYNLTANSNLCNIFQLAINEIGKNGGGVLYVKAGTYTLNCNLFLVSKIKFTGEGMDQTILKLANMAKRFDKAGFLRTRLTSNIIVSKLTLDGNKNGQSGDYNDYINYGRYGIFTEACNNVWFDQVRVTNFQGYGFDPHGWKAGGIWGNQLTLTNCVANGNMFDGFALDQSYNIIVQGCTAYANGRHGFNIITGSQRVKIVNNLSYNNGFTDPHGGAGCAYMYQNNGLFGTNDIFMVNNKGINCKKAGICINDIHTMETQNNTMDQMPAYCFDLTQTTGTAFYNTTCKSNKMTKLVNTIASSNISTYNSATQVLIDSTNTWTKA